MDLDIEMGDVAEAVTETQASLISHDDILQPDEPDEPGEVSDDENQKPESQLVVPNKLHIRGVDSLHTEDIKAYVKGYFGHVDKIEWIDDTSANLVFGSVPIAKDAMMALSAMPIADASALPAGESIMAKPMEGRREITLSVRFALESDKKQPGASLRSRYYLFHPEHDPEERRRNQFDSRSRFRDRDNEYRVTNGRIRGDSDDHVVFEASMYDDAPRSSIRDSTSLGDRRRSYSKENRGKELFSNRSQRRDRSASPLRGFEGEAAMVNLASSSANREKAKAIRSRITTENSRKELFPSKSSGRGGQLDKLEAAIGSAHLREEDMPKIVSNSTTTGDGGFNIKGIAYQASTGPGFSIKGAASARELFPDKLGDTNAGKELFDGRSKQRQKAQDLFG